MEETALPVYIFAEFVTIITTEAIIFFFVVFHFGEDD